MEDRKGVCKMKKRSINIWMTLVIVMCVAVLAGCGHKPSETTGIPDKIIIGMDDNFPPMGFRDDQGQLVGFDIDVAKEASKRLGIPVEFQSIDWDSKEAALKSGQVDVLWNGLTITPERQKVIAFSKPYMKNDQLLVVRSDSPIHDKQDFSGKCIGTQEGSSSIDALNRHKDFQRSLKGVKKYGDYVNAFMDLEVGRIDGVLVDSVVGRYYMEKKPGKFKVVDKSLGEETFGIGMRKEDKPLQDKMNKVMAELSRDGTLSALSKKWLGDDITMKIQ